MSEYNVKDYEMFSSAIDATNNSVKTLLECFQSVQQEANKLKNSEIFCGPLCESAVQEWDVINSKSEDIIKGFNSISSYLSETSQAYAQTDATTSKELEVL